MLMAGTCCPHTRCMIIQACLTVIIGAVTNKPPVCVCVCFFPCPCINRPTARSDQAGGAPSVLPEQWGLFPAHHATPLLHLDRRIRQRHRKEQGPALSAAKFHQNDEKTSSVDLSFTRKNTDGVRVLLDRTELSFQGVNKTLGGSNSWTAQREVCVDGKERGVYVCVLLVRCNRKRMQNMATVQSLDWSYDLLLAEQSADLKSDKKGSYEPHYFSGVVLVEFVKGSRIFFVF